jgi:hypothetical protein
MEALTETRMKIALLSSPSAPSEYYVRWVGERNTDKFIKEFTHLRHDDEQHHRHTNEWYTALDSSGEVLVWVGKFKNDATGSKNGAMEEEEYYGAELPIVKTISIGIVYGFVACSAVQ